MSTVERLWSSLMLTLIGSIAVLWLTMIWYGVRGISALMAGLLS